MGMIRRALVWGLLAYALTVLAVAGFASFKPIRADADMPEADVIVVLGAGMEPDGDLHVSTELRVARAAGLFKAGAAPRVLMTGGAARTGGPTAADGMAELAVALGVPQTAILRENRSTSTLQNALFSVPALAGAERIILVTEGFHLPRAWASFRWAGAPPEIVLAVSTRFRWLPRGGPLAAIRMVLREALAWWFNGARMAAFGLGGLIGIPEDDRVPWLV